MYNISPKELKEIYTDFLCKVPYGEMKNLDFGTSSLIEELILFYDNDTSLSTTYQDRGITITCKYELLTIKDVAST